jgi:hypothetical protein
MNAIKLKPLAPFKCCNRPLLNLVKKIVAEYKRAMKELKGWIIKLFPKFPTVSFAVILPDQRENSMSKL